MFIPSSDSEAEESVVQTSESTFRRQRATDVERLDLGYLQVWLYAMRHYPLMPPDPKKKGDLLAKPARPKADERTIYEMAELARRLGFKSPEIDALIDGSPDHQIARTALLQARKPSRFRYDAQRFDTLVSRIVDCFTEAVPGQPNVLHDLLADSTMKPQARCGMPQTRAHEQDSPLLFLDRLHDDVEVADNITSFFVRRCVYFAFFGKPTRYEPTNRDQTGESPWDMPSPLFIGEHADLPREPPQQDELHGHRGGRNREQLGRSQAQKAERDALRRRRMRKARIHRRRSRPTGEGDQLPMDWERQSTEPSERMSTEPSERMEPSDQGMSDQGHSPGEHPDPDEGRQNKSPPGSAMNLILHTAHAPAPAEEADTYTRYSLETAQLEKAVEVPHQGDGPEDGARIHRPSQPQSTELEDGNLSNVGSSSGRQDALDEYVDQLMKAQGEQQRLEELERERLNEDTGLPNRERPVLEPSPRTQEGPNSTPSPPDGQPGGVTHTEDPGLAQTAVTGPIQDTQPAPYHEGPEPPANLELPAPTTRDDDSRLSQNPPVTTAEAPPPPATVEISFWNFEREGWRLSDRVRVDPSDPSPVERVARKYSWKDYSLYDKNLQSVSPAQCYRAATVDGNNTIFLISEHEEKKLAAVEGRIKDKQLLWLVSRVLDQTEPEAKRRRSCASVTSEEL